MRHRHRHWGCHPRGHIQINVPEGLLAMGRSGGWGPFHFEWDEDGWGGGHHRGRGRRRMFESGELRLVLLKLIADEPRHGYDLIRAIEEITGGRYAPSPGVIYPTLTLLEDMGLIQEAAGEGSRKPFQATGEGREMIADNGGEIADLFTRLEDMKPDQSGNPPIGRAVKNLMTALGQRVGRDGLDEDLLHEIAAILDEAAQRIERLKKSSDE